MGELTELLASEALLPALAPASAKVIADRLGNSLGQVVYPNSLAAQGGMIYFLSRRGREKFLGLAWEADKPPAVVGDFFGETLEASLGEASLHLKIAPTNIANAAALRRHLSFTAPQLMGKRAALGCGDRLGIATPGHIRAVRGSGLAGFFAQQSARELTRTHRTPQQIMDAATWGVFQEGWREGYGADADHLKTPEDIDAYLAAGFTFFTIDPGDQVEPAADSLSPALIMKKFSALPWEQLETTAEEQRQSYLDRKLSPAENLTIEFNEETLLRAAVKYGNAIAQVTKMFRHLQAQGKPFELEISVDETATPTSLAEHYYVARELQRLGVSWVSLAPRFVGRFEKGVDYIGDLVEFADTCRGHVAIARALGDYKLSLHSGSDKFSIYPIFAHLAGERVQVKTAGTSYLEALRVITELAPALFREILEFACECYPQDRASYHVSGELYEVPKTEGLPDSALPAFLEHFDTREILHVTFGSVLTDQAGESYRFRERLLAVLQEDEESYYAALEAHFRRHIQPFAQH